MASPSLPPSSVLAVVVNAGSHTVSLVRSDGTVVNSNLIAPLAYVGNKLMPYWSASLTRLYYLGGDSWVHFVTPGGEAGTATRIPLGANEQAGFSVSPDDTRIAVAIFTYEGPSLSDSSSSAPTFHSMRMYVEDLEGGGHHHDIFSSTTVMEFPVAWVGGRLVIAVSSSVVQQPPANPYNASSYHVVDPNTGDRFLTVCDHSVGPIGIVRQTGAICWHPSGAPSFEGWDGTALPLPTAVPSPSQYLVAVSPSMDRVAVGGATNIRIMSRDPDILLGFGGYAIDWLDADHVVYRPVDAHVFFSVDLRNGQSAQLADATSYWGTFPAVVS